MQQYTQDWTTWKVWTSGTTCNTRSATGSTNFLQTNWSISTSLWKAHWRKVLPGSIPSCMTFLSKTWPNSNINNWPPCIIRWETVRLKSSHFKIRSWLNFSHCTNRWASNKKQTGSWLTPSPASHSPSSNHIQKSSMKVKERHTNLSLTSTSPQRSVSKSHQCNSA